LTRMGYANWACSQRPLSVPRTDPCWIWLVVLAYTQRRLARPVVPDHLGPMRCMGSALGTPRPAGQLRPIQFRTSVREVRSLHR
jgi:hypothetical protein